MIPRSARAAGSEAGADTVSPVTSPEPASAAPAPGGRLPVDGSYPPEHHVLRDLRLESEAGPDLTARGWIDVGDALRGPTDLAHPGALATLVDAVGGGLAATAARPDWIATADLTMHIIPRPGVTRVQATGRVLRAGRTTVVIEVDITSADGDTLGMATMTFAILPRRDGNPVIDPVAATRRTTMALADSGFTQSIEATTGLRVLDDATGTVHLPLTDYVRNTLGAVQGGMMAMTAAVAAERALSSAADAHIDVVDLQVTYLALAKVGPVASTVRILDVQPDFATAHVELTDAGAADGRVTTTVRARGVRLRVPAS